MSPIDVQDILERAKNSSQVGDHEEAERLLKSYIAKIPESREAHLLLGTTFARQGNLTEAADEFITLLTRNPNDIEALNNAAVICRRQGKYQEALDYLKDAIDIDPAKAELYYNIGNIHKQQNNFKAASMAYARVIELDPNYVSAYNNLGTIYDQLKEYDKAYGVFRKGLALDNNNPTLHFNYGVSLESNSRLDDAAEEYKAALRSKPGWLAPMNNLGIIYFKQGRHNNAMTQFNHVLAVDPFNAEAYNNMGVVLSDQGRTTDAIKNYRQAIEADPRHIKAVVNLERELESSGDFSDALLELEKLVKLSPDSADIRNRLAALYLKLERYPEALEQAEAALDWEPENIQALRIKGTVQRILGNDAGAQNCFEKILALDPGNYSFLLDLADIHFRRREFKEAEERLKAYLIRRPNDRNAKLLLGKLYAEMENRTHAIQVFEELSKEDPNDAEALAAAAELQKKAGLLEKALRSADSLVNLQGKRATADDLSELNKSLEFYESAVNAYSSSVKEMWDRNMKLVSGEAESGRDSVPSPEDEIDLLMGSAGISQSIDEETEALFTEGPETFNSEEEDRDLVFEDEFPEIESPGEEQEEAEQKQPYDPFNDLVEAPPFPPATPPPLRPHDFPPETSHAEDLPSAYPPEEDEIPPAEPEELEEPILPEDEAGAPENETESVNEDEPVNETEPVEAEPEEAESEIPLEDEDTALLPPEPEDAIPVPQEEEDEGLSVTEDIPEKTFDEEIPEEIAGEDITGAGTAERDITGEEPDALEEMEPLDFKEKQPESGFPERGETVFFPGDEKPSASEAVFSSEAEAPSIGEEEPVPGEELDDSENDKNISVEAIIGLLNYLKTLTDKLPAKEQKSFLQGKFSGSLKSVIDSLEHLTIIKESDTEPQDGDQVRDGDSDGNGS